LETDSKNPPRMRGAVSERTAGAAVAVILFLIGLIMIWDNYKLGAGWAPDGPQAGYFPLRIGVIICVASLYVLIRTLTRPPGDKPPAVFVTTDRLRYVFAVLAPAAVFVAAINFLGIYVSATLFIGGFMRVMDKFGWVKTLSISIGTSAMLFWLFEMQFLVPLPKGPLEALFGY
jgi:hypothetical protein